MHENYIYPVKVKEEDGMFLVSFPDFPDQMTDADSEQEMIRNAQEMLAVCILDNEEQGIDNPEPSKEESIVLEEGERLLYVHLWMPYFRNITREVYVKKTLTIPQWLDLLAKEKGVNFSAALVNGLKRELGMDGNSTKA